MPADIVFQSLAKAKYQTAQTERLFRAITKIAMRDTAHVCMSNNLYVSLFEVI